MAEWSPYLTLNGSSPPGPSKVQGATLSGYSEGEYAGLGERNLSARGNGGEVAIQSAPFTGYGCERIMRFAFDRARTRTNKKVSNVTKSNAQSACDVTAAEVDARARGDQ